MAYVMEDIGSYAIYFVHQQDSRDFNRGAMKNIGFLAMRDKYPATYKNTTFVFNDVDTMPFSKNFLNYATQIGIVKHFYGWRYALGASSVSRAKTLNAWADFPTIGRGGLKTTCFKIV